MSAATSMVRRGIEAVLALVLLLVVAPLILGAALVSAFELRAWPLFTHDRVGRGGSAIRVTKIRTLPRHTGVHLDKYKLREIEIPPRMRFIRKLHLDELPQLWSVIAGRLSLVGPRPEMRPLHDRLPAAFARERTTVRPGLTGLWQIGRGVGGLIGESPEYDQFYLRHRTLRLDLWILYRTALKITVGALVTLDDVPAWTTRSTPSVTPANIASDTGPGI